MVRWAAESDIGVYGHSLVWYYGDQMPEWLKYVDPAPTGSETIGDLEWMMARHITGIIQRYCQESFGGAVYAYDVVNEAINAETGGLVTGGMQVETDPILVKYWGNPWYGIGDTDLNDAVNVAQTLTGDNYARRAFGYARQAVQAHCSGQPIELFLNDAKQEHTTFSHPPAPNPSLQGVRDLVTALHTPFGPSDPFQAHYPLLDGVGVQSHALEMPESGYSSHNPNPAGTLADGTKDWVEVMGFYANLGLKIKITEIDVSLARAVPPTPTPLATGGVQVVSTPTLAPCPDPANNVYPRYGDWGCNLPLAAVPTYFPRQAEVYQAVLESCLQLNLRWPHTCTGFTTWGVEDSGSWRNCFYPSLWNEGTPRPCETPEPTPTRPVPNQGTPTPTRTATRTPVFYHTPTRTPTRTRTPTPDAGCERFCRAGRGCLLICENGIQRPARERRGEFLVAPTQYVRKPAYFKVRDTFLRTPTPFPALTITVNPSVIAPQLPAPPTPLGGYPAPPTATPDPYP